MTNAPLSHAGEAEVALETIREAASRLAGVAVRTPLLCDTPLDRLVGGRLLLKVEPLQRTGSFKFRGAYNAIARSAKSTVVAWSSGNHAQGVALAAALLGRRAIIVMPADAPRIKIDRTRAFGAEVVLYDRVRESREAVGTRIALETAAEIVAPYDDPRVIAGQGTVGLEIVEQARAAGRVPDLVFVPCGGGGLVAGCATALKGLLPRVRVFSVEPEGHDDTARSLAAGERLANPPGVRSFCDALLAPEPGRLTFAINRRLLAGGLVVSDAEVRRAMRLAFSELKLVLEPGGAVALAAVLSGRVDCRGRTVAVVLSGGNVDPEPFARLLLEPADPG
ncbi:MAG: threonine/serine dehydratase [Geminicoccaceae bacterium]|nr:threonine/serine dehydratase [Geminicoccaceae bacterium]